MRCSGQQKVMMLIQPNLGTQTLIDADAFRGSGFAPPVIVPLQNPQPLYQQQVD